MFLKELESWLERGQNVPFLREISPRKKCTPNIGADIGAITGILLSIHVLSYLGKHDYKYRIDYSIGMKEYRNERVKRGNHLPRRKASFLIANL
jgi:hypothetical protein